MSKIKRSRFKIGDIVKVIDYGYVYTTYEDAFRYFKILSSCYVYKNHYVNPVSELESKKGNWVIINIAYHSSSLDAIYCLKNSFNKYLVIGTNGIKKNEKIKSNSNVGFCKKINKICIIPEY